MSSRSVRVLLVARDGMLLSQLSRLLGLLHYEAEQVHPEEALSALDAATFDVLLIDWFEPADRVWELCRAAQASAQRDSLLTLLIADQREPAEIAAAIEAGVDDFLSRPVVVGELLVRLRAAVRAGEFERRLQMRTRRDALTGLRSRSGLVAQFRTMASSSATCIALEIDFCEALARRWGRPLADAAIRRVADALREACGAALPAHLGHGRFAVVHPGQSLADALSWADEVRNRLATLELPGEKPPLRVTVSAGVAASPHDAPWGESLLAKAEEALSLAQRTGRNRGVAARDLQHDAEAWAEWAKPGSLFERTTARDVMIACPTVLAPDEPMSRLTPTAAAAGVCPWPVAGADGRLVGVLLPAEPRGHAGSAASPEARVADCMTDGVATFDVTATLAEVMAFFREDDRGLAVVTLEGRPVGWVTPSLLAGLHTPLTTSTFAPEDPASPNLAVPDPALLEGA